MKTFKDWLKNEVSKPVAAGVGFFLGGIPGAVAGYHLGQDKEKSSSPTKPERKSSGKWPSQGMANLSPEELLQKGVIQGEIVRDITDRTGGRSIETRWPNGVKSTKFIGSVDQVPRDMVGISAEELLQNGIIQGKVIKDEVRDISPGVRERWIITQSKTGVETIKFIGNM